MQHMLCIGPGKNIINEGKYILKHAKQDDPNVFIHFVDQSFKEMSFLDDVEVYKKIYDESQKEKRIQTKIYGDDIFTFLENYKIRNISYIVANRVFEHIPREKMFYLLYLLKDISEDGAILSIVVPNFIEIFEKLLTLDKNLLPENFEKKDSKWKNFSPSYIDQVSQFEKSLIDIHTEIFNEPSDPHRIVWTPGLAKYYIELENYWKITNIDKISLDNREWYLKILSTVTG
jgi:hypothetical protein